MQFVLYLQLRSAVRIHGYQWESPLPTHPLSMWVNPQSSSVRLVSTIYNDSSHGIVILGDNVLDLKLQSGDLRKKWT